MYGGKLRCLQQRRMHSVYNRTLVCGHSMRCAVLLLQSLLEAFLSLSCLEVSCKSFGSTCVACTSSECLSCSNGYLYLGAATKENVVVDNSFAFEFSAWQLFQSGNGGSEHVSYSSSFEGRYGIVISNANFGGSW